MGDLGIKAASIWNRLKRGSLGLIIAAPLTFGIVSKAHSQEKYEPSYTEIRTITDYGLINEKITLDIGKTYQEAYKTLEEKGIGPGLYMPGYKINPGQYAGGDPISVIDGWVVWHPGVPLEPMVCWKDYNQFLRGGGKEIRWSLPRDVPRGAEVVGAIGKWGLRGEFPPMEGIAAKIYGVPETKFGVLDPAFYREQYQSEPFKQHLQNLDALQTPDLANPLTGRYKMPEISQFPFIDAEMRNSLYKLQVEADISKSLRDPPKMPPNQFDMSLSTWNTLQGLDTKLTKGLTPDANFGRVFTAPSDYKGLTAKIRTGDRLATIPIAPRDYYLQQNREVPRIEIPRIRIPDPPPPPPPRIEYRSTSTYGSMGYDPFRYGSMGYDPFRKY